jgi:hypothetical protein
MSRPRLGRAGVLAGVLTLALAGCADEQDRAAADATEQFYAAVGSGDGATACALLAARARDELEQSSGKPCDRAILEEDLPAGGSVGAAEVYGTMAQVAFGTDTVFLTRFDTGWRVVGSGCTPSGVDRPFSCRVKVG